MSWLLAASKEELWIEQVGEGRRELKQLLL